MRMEKLLDWMMVIIWFRMLLILHLVLEKLTAVQRHGLF